MYAAALSQSSVCLFQMMDFSGLLHLFAYMFTYTSPDYVSMSFFRCQSLYARNNCNVPDEPGNGAPSFFLQLNGTNNFHPKPNYN